MSPSLPEILRSLWHRRLGLIEHWRPAVRQGKDPEALHQFRVSIRTLLSIHAAFGLKTIHPELGPVCRRLKDILQAAGPTRDLDVQLVRVRDLEEEAGNDLADFLADWRRFLTTQRSRAFRTWVSELERFPDLVDLKPVSSEAEESRHLQTCFHHHLHRRSDHIHKVLHALNTASLTDETSTRLHRLRIRLKQVRYPLAVWNEFLGGRLDPDLATFKQLQDELGTYHDQEVHLAWLNAFFQQTPAPQTGAGNDYLVQASQRRQRLFRRFRDHWLEGQLEEFLRSLTSRLEPEPPLKSPLA
ncbi:MAG: CHAD domain-containing protein [Candidatus Neomarinimicrobiota bacterium]|nr:MAG: CHAD domain-containing protein [Candidatus Neomarinimicrobiota bacterium]